MWTSGKRRADADVGGVPRRQPAGGTFPRRNARARRGGVYATVDRQIRGNLSEADSPVHYAVPIVGLSSSEHKMMGVGSRVLCGFPRPLWARSLRPQRRRRPRPNCIGPNCVARTPPDSRKRAWSADDAGYRTTRCSRTRPSSQRHRGDSGGAGTDIYSPRAIPSHGCRRFRSPPDAALLRTSNA